MLQIREGQGEAPCQRSHDCLLHKSLQEIDELCNEWQPEPLEDAVLPARQHLDPPVLSDTAGPYVTADSRRVLNLASTNFLNIAGDPDIRVSLAPATVPLRFHAAASADIQTPTYPGLCNHSSECSYGSTMC